nr:cryptochrome-2 isoform X2 [Bubalus bubalis]
MAAAAGTTSAAAAATQAPAARGDGASSVHWFRKGLRLHDNPALLAAVRGAHCVRCVYILDPWFAASSSVGINRWRFLLQSLEDLDRSLRKLNSRLFVVRGQPADVFPRLFKEWGVTRLTFEYDSEPFGKERDAAIMKMAKEAGVEVVTENSHTLYDLDKIIELNGQKPPLTYKRFQAIISRMELPRKPVGSVTSQQMEGCRAEIQESHDETYGVPSLEELGFPTEGLGPAVWRGGETEALARLDKHLERKVKRNSTPPLSLFGQLLWREFFYTAATNNPRFDRMEGNPICIQIPWDRNPEALAKWAEGKTGFPWIDAIMTQLRQEGWIHHLARHAVACFLTRGDLWVSWESGVRVFDELLLDADFSVNAGSWMWLSCSAFFQQFFHCYCPVGFGRRTDPSGDYIRSAGVCPFLCGRPQQPSGGAQLEPGRELKQCRPKTTAWGPSVSQAQTGSSGGAAWWRAQQTGQGGRVAPLRTAEQGCLRLQCRGSMSKAWVPKPPPWQRSATCRAADTCRDGANVCACVCACGGRRATCCVCMHLCTLVSLNAVWAGGGRVAASPQPLDPGLEVTAVAVTPYLSLGACCLFCLEGWSDLRWHFDTCSPSPSPSTSD